MEKADWLIVAFMKDKKREKPNDILVQCKTTASRLKAWRKPEENIVIVLSTVACNYFGDPSSAVACNFTFVPQGGGLENPDWLIVAFMKDKEREKPKDILVQCKTTASRLKVWRIPAVKLFS